MMKNVDLPYLCTVIGNLTGMPIRIFFGEDLFFHYSIVQLSGDPMELYREEIFRIQTNVGYFVTSEFFYYGIINSGDQKIVLGPTRQISGNDQELLALAFQLGIAQEDTEDFLRGIKSIIPMPLESVMQILCAVNYVLNEEKLTLQDISIYDAEQDDLRKQLIAQQATLNKYSSEAEDQDTQSIHNSFQLEQVLMDIIRRGDTAALREWIASAPAVNGGRLAAEQLRQIKNTFIVTATLASRAAIRGGLDVDDAFSLSDSFIQKCELLNSAEQIINLQYHMVLSFTEKVERIRAGKNPSKLVTDVANYIQHHLSEPITAEDIAKSLYLSRPYLSRKFIEETGESLTDFILKEKTEEAKRLLRYTDRSAAAIGTYLGYSSNGHFARVFKKYAGITPREYREKYTR